MLEFSLFKFGPGYRDHRPSNPVIPNVSATASLWAILIFKEAFYSGPV